MKKKTLFTILFATLAFYGCGDGENGTGGEGGSAGTGGTGGGTGGSGGGTGGTGGGTGGSGGTGGIVGEVLYEQDFNQLDIGGTVIGDEWKFFNNVFDGDGVFKFGYTSPSGLAPNGPQISALVDDQGGPPQGLQQLSVYSDYECCGNPDQGHRNGTDLVETNVFRELTITAADIGNTVTFSFDAKATSPPNGVSGATTANAFIKTIDAKGNLTNNPSTDTTNLPVDWTRLMVSLDLTDSALEGQTLQVGFQTNASDFEPSGNFYDNVLVAKSPTAP